MAIPILVVEDDPPIRRGICDLLAFHGHAPHGVGDGQAGLDAAISGTYPLMLLDVMLPELDGFTVCSRVREAHVDVAILMLTAKGAEEDILRGFDAGADDYVTKPFSVAQLMARVKALLRRVRPPNRFTLGAVEVDADTLEAHHGAGTTGLTGRDIELLAYLRDADQRVVSRDELLKQVWGYQRTEGVETRCVDMHIVKLRKKLARITDTEVIHTVRGAGYRVKP